MDAAAIMIGIGGAMLLALGGTPTLYRDGTASNCVGRLRGSRGREPGSGERNYVVL